MKKQILTTLLLTLLTTVGFAQEVKAPPAKKPFTMGNVTFKDERVIINDNIVCSAHTLPTDAIDASKIIHGEFLAVMQKDDSFNITGRIDGSIFSVLGNTKRGSVTLSLQELTEMNVKPAYSANSIGDFTQESKVASLNMTVNGKHISVSCVIKE